MKSNLFFSQKLNPQLRSPLFFLAQVPLNWFSHDKLYSQTSYCLHPYSINRKRRKRSEIKWLNRIKNCQSKTTIFFLFFFPSIYLVTSIQNCIIGSGTKEQFLPIDSPFLFLVYLFPSWKIQLACWRECRHLDGAGDGEKEREGIKNEISIRLH